MKTTISRSKHLLMLMALSSTMVSFQALAQNEDAILNSDPININGYMVEEQPVTDGELENVKNELRKQKNAITINKEKSKKYNELGRTTEKLADVTEEMIDERKESKETIAKYNKKVECLMQENPGRDCDEFVKNKNRRDEVSTGQAAPVLEVAVKKEEPKSVMNAIKVLPYAGFLSYSGTRETLESTFDVGLKVEADVASRFSVGAGIGYTSLTTNDFNNGNMNNGYYGGGYWGAYGNQGREIDYGNLRFDLYSKFFIINSERFRPFVGLGVAYNRASMEYSDNTMYNTGYYNYGNEELNYSYMSASVVGGVEVSFTEMIGLNVEVNYSRGISGNLSNDQTYNNMAYAPDQFRLRQLRDELVDANVIGVNASLLIKF